MGTEKRLIYLEDAIARIVDTPSDVATMAFEGYYGYIRNPGNIFADRQHEIIDLLEAVSTVDAVEVVRCKDCNHYHTHNRSVRFDCKELYCCRSALKKVDPEDFCSFGERKNNNEHGSNNCC